MNWRIIDCRSNFTADVDILAPGGVLTGTNNMTGGSVTFYLDGDAQTPVPVNSSGIKSLRVLAAAGIESKSHRRPS